MIHFWRSSINLNSKLRKQGMTFKGILMHSLRIPPQNSSRRIRKWHSSIKILMNNPKIGILNSNKAKEIQNRK